MAEWWVFNRESVQLAAVVALVSGPLFAIGHELTKWLIAVIRSNIGK